MTLQEYKDKMGKPGGALGLHDYDNCLVNLANSVLKRFEAPAGGGAEAEVEAGAETGAGGKTLAAVDRYLDKGYKNVVVLLLDGLGTRIMERNLREDSFLRANFKSSISSVFPPTTVAATTAVMSGLQPIESAWLGWDCYYPQVDKNVTVFFNTEQGTDIEVSTENIPWTYYGYESVVNRLVREGKNAYNAIPFLPPFPKTFPEICDRIEELCESEGEKYIYAYWDEPDSVMHKYGCYSAEARDVIGDLDKTVKKLAGKLKDTLLIVTADHGHIDGRNVSITDYPAIMECLVRMPSVEPRALNLFVKEEKRAQFERAFNKEFGEDFVLLTKEEVYETKLFGTGEPHKNVDAMIGDYLAVAITDLTIFNNREEAKHFKSVHAGYTREELTIPLIVIEK